MATQLAERSQTTREKLSGIWSPVLTPVDADLNPHPGRFVAHARWLLDNGCHGLVVFGTTGEANSFSVDERIELLDAAVSAGLPRERLLVGTGCCALTDTVRLTRHALSLGIGGVLALPPFYYKDNSDEALFASFDEVIQRVGGSGFKLYLYHFPRLSGVPITPGLLERLLAAYPDTVAGVKDSSGDWGNTRMMLERFPEIAIMPGAESYLLSALEAGASGCISASCNVNARGHPQALRRFQGGQAGPAGAAGGAQRRAQGPAAPADDPGDEAPARRCAARARLAQRPAAAAAAAGCRGRSTPERAARARLEPASGLRLRGADHGGG